MAERVAFDRVCQRMISSLRSEWLALRRAPPGQRFQRRYENNRAPENKRSLTGRVVRLALAAVAFAIGVVLVFIPGPAIVFFVLAGSLLAAESLILAKILDRLEIWIRRALRVAKRVWRSLPLAGKVLVGLVVVACGASFTYLSWRMLFG